MRALQKGFTLIEALIAVAIVGILSSIAVPQYNLYVTRAKISEAVQLTNFGRMALENTFTKTRSFAHISGLNLTDRNHAVGLNAPNDYATDTVVSMWVGSTGTSRSDVTSAHISVVVDRKWNDGRGARLLSTIEFNGTSFKFVCGNTNVPWPTTIKSEYLPESCRN